MTIQNYITTGRKAFDGAVNGILVIAVVLMTAGACFGWGWIKDSGWNQAVAAWVQAIGSVLAILGAFAVSSHQHEAAKQLQEAQYSRAVINRLEVFRLLIEQTCEFAKTMAVARYDPQFIQTAEGRRNSKSKLMQWLTDLRAIPLVELPNAQIAAAAIRSYDLIEQLIALLKDDPNNPDAPTLGASNARFAWGGIEGALRHSIATIDEELVQLRQGLEAK